MSKLTYPISKIEGSIAVLSLPKSIYDAEAIRQTAYKFSGDYYVIAQENVNSFEITFESKVEGVLSELIVKEICNDFIDQQIRIDTENQFGHIRDLIVEEAFSPVTKSK